MGIELFSLLLPSENFKIMNAVNFVHEQLTATPALPSFKAGDNITVNYKIVEGTKERIQSFKGDVIKRQGVGATATFTIKIFLAFIQSYY